MAGHGYESSGRSASELPAPPGGVGAGMPDHNPDVAAVLAKAPCIRPEKVGMTGLVVTCDGHPTKHPECALAALSAAGYAVVAVPEGVAAVLAEARTMPCSLCKGTGIFEYDSDCGDSTCGAPHATRRVECRTCRGEGGVPVGPAIATATLAALTEAGYAVVKLPEGLAVAHGARLAKVGFAADTTTRNAEIDELGYFSTDADANRDHSVPLYVIEQPEQPEVVLVVDFPSPGPDTFEDSP